MNLIDAIEGTITYDGADGRHYELIDNPATLLVRPRGWHLPEKHLTIDGEPVAGAFMDFGLYAFHCGKRLAERDRGLYLYLPKMEHHHEAALWNDVFTFTREALGLPRGPDPRDGADRDAARRVPDGGDHPRARRALLRPQRRPLGLHLLDDQGLPRRPGLRAAGPQRREDDRPVHARLHRAAGQDLPRARRVRDGRHGRADPLAQGRGGQPARDRRRQGRQGARGQGRLRRHLGRAPGRRRRRAGRVRRGARQPPEPDRQAALRRRRRRPSSCSTRPPPRARSPRRACAPTSTSASSTSRSGSAAAARRASTT